MPNKCQKVDNRIVYSFSVLLNSLEFVVILAMKQEGQTGSDVRT